MKNKLIFVLITGLFLVFSCVNDDKGETLEDTFDRTAFLENFANNIIKPNFANLKTKTDALDRAIFIFTNESNETNLIAAQNAWEEAYTAYQHCNAFNFGPAEFPVFGTLNENVAIFPVNTTKIEENIKNNNLSFDNFLRDTRGFLALDYLLFDSENNSNVLVKYTTAATSRKEYLKKVSDDIKKKVNEINTGWASYSNTFISNNGTDAGSSTSYIYNELIKSFEIIKNFKVNHPAGKRAGQTKSEPEKVEAYYSGKSIKFLKENLKSIENIWTGKKFNGNDGIGFEEYLATVKGGNELIIATKAQLEVVAKSINDLPNERLSNIIKTNEKIIETTGIELQKQTRFFKSDMSSLLGIAITFSSGDGD